MRPASPDEATSASGGARIRPLTGRYLVTGCAGFIGSYLAEALLARGDSVVGVDAFTDYYPRTVKEENLAGLRARPGFSFVEADLARAPLGELVDVDGVFHLAAQPGVRGSWGDTFALYTRDNLLATQRVFEASAERGVRIVFASSSSVYGNAEAYPTPEETRPRPVSPYGVTKLSCEHLAQTYGECFGLDVVGMRYFTVYGPRQRPDMAFTRIATALATGRPFHVFGSGEQSRDFTYVDDAVAATIAALERAPAGAVYNVGGGTEATLRNVIRTCERLSGRRLDVRFEAPATGDVRRTAADTSRIRNDVGWTPQTPLEEGLRAQLTWAGALVGERRAVG
jgi:UDP-glucuronate 4-epimerase